MIIDLLEEIIIKNIYRANKFKKGKRESIKIKTDNKPRNFESNEIPKKNKGKFDIHIP